MYLKMTGLWLTRLSLRFLNFFVIIFDFSEKRQLLNLCVLLLVRIHQALDYVSYL